VLARTRLAAHGAGYGTGGGEVPPEKPRRMPMLRKPTRGAFAFLMLAYTPNLARAEFIGTVRSGAVVKVEVVTVDGQLSAATIVEFGNDKIPDVISLSAEQDAQSAELTPSRGTRRILIEVDPCLGCAVRVSITAHGTPVIPDETINADKRYVLDVQQ
jgi:hypothetical protein